MCWPPNIPPCHPSGATAAERRNDCPTAATVRASAEAVTANLISRSACAAVNLAHQPAVTAQASCVSAAIVMIHHATPRAPDAAPWHGSPIGSTGNRSVRPADRTSLSPARPAAGRINAPTRSPTKGPSAPAVTDVAVRTSAISAAASRTTPVWLIGPPAPGSAIAVGYRRPRRVVGAVASDPALEEVPPASRSARPAGPDRADPDSARSANTRRPSRRCCRWEGSADRACGSCDDIRGPAPYAGMSAPSSELATAEPGCVDSAPATGATGRVMTAAEWTYSSAAHSVWPAPLRDGSPTR